MPRVVLATGVEEIDRELAGELTRHNVECIGECHYLEGVLPYCRQKGADTAVISPELPGTGSLSDTMISLRKSEANIRVILLPGPIDLVEPLKLAQGVFWTGIYDFVFSSSSTSGSKVNIQEVVRRVLEPATFAEAEILLASGWKMKDRPLDLQRQRISGRQNVSVLLAAGDDSESLRVEVERHGITVAGVCRYREQLLTAVKKTGTGVVVLSSALPGTISIADLVSALRSTRIVLMPGRRDDLDSLEIAHDAVGLGVRDIAWDIAGAMERIINPSKDNHTDLHADCVPLSAKRESTVKKIGKNGELFAFFFKRPKPFKQVRGTKILPSRVEPVRIVSNPIAKVSALGFDAAFPTVSPDDAEIIFVTPDRLPEIYGRPPAGAKIFLVGEGAATWRQALETGLTPVLPEKIQEQISMHYSLSVARKCLIVYSSKTAVGKTSITQTAAVLLAQKGKKVCLVDADKDGRTSTKLLLGDRKAVGGNIYSSRYGVDVLCTTEDDEPAYNRLAAYALNNYDAVIVDCPGRLRMPIVAEAFLGASLVLLVSSCSSASVASVQGFLGSKMRDYEIGDRTVLVCNRSEKAPPLQPGDVAREIGFQPFEELPFDELVDRMFASRTPLPAIRSRKVKPFEKAVHNILEHYLPEVMNG
jgi:MinD-like ATPase involved in chromosome partitioning or flagellar assembly